MNPKQKIKRLYELLGNVLEGLEGNPFSWGEGQRTAWMPMLKKVGVTLTTKTQIEKQGYRIKRGAKPVGSAYFGSPIQRWADLYVLEVQCTKPKPLETDCWLFLDCQVMTGKPAQKCPNRRQCKQQALHSSNRSCEIPYTYQVFDPQSDQLFTQLACWLRVHHSCSEEAKAVGWHPAVDVFYDYRPGELLIGKDHHGSYRKIPEAAKAVGFAKAEETPYWLNSQPGKLIVTRYHPMSSYPSKFKEAGWHPAIELPYFILPDWDDRQVLVLTVSFAHEDPAYAEAITTGWHPACLLERGDRHDETC